MTDFLEEETLKLFQNDNYEYRTSRGINLILFRFWVGIPKRKSLNTQKNNLLAAISEGFKEVSWCGWKPDQDKVYNSLVLTHIIYILCSCLSLLDFFLFRQVEDPKLIQACTVLVQVIPLPGPMSIPWERTLGGPGWDKFLFSWSLVCPLAIAGNWKHSSGVSLWTLQFMHPRSAWITRCP